MLTYITLKKGNVLVLAGPNGLNVLAFIQDNMLPHVRAG